MANVAEIIIKARDEASSVLNRVAGEVGGLSGTISRIAGAAGGIGLVAAAAVTAGTAVFAMGQRFADQVERLDRVAASAGTTTDKIQVLERAFKNAGLSEEEAGGALTFLNRAIGRSDPLLKALGITTRDAHEALLQLGDVFAGSEDAAKKQAIALKLTGRSSSELVGVLGTLRSAVAEARADMDKAGGIFGENTLRRGRELDKALDQLNTKWSSTMSALLATSAQAAPAVVKALTSILDAVTKFYSLKDISVVVQLVGTDHFKDNLKDIGDLTIATMAKVAIASQAIGDAIAAVGANQATAVVKIAEDARKAIDLIDSATRRHIEERAAAPRSQETVNQFGEPVRTDEPLTRPAAKPAPGGDSLASVNPGDEAKLQKHLDLVAAIRSQLHLSRDEAERLAREYEHVKESVNLVADVTKTLMVGPEIPDSVKKVAESAEQLRITFGVTGQEAQAMAERLDAIAKLDFAAGIRAQLDPERAIRADRVAALAEAFGMAADKARDLYLAELGLQGFTVDDSQRRELEKLADALERVRQEQARRAAVKSLEPLLTRGDVPDDRKKEISTAISQATVDDFSEKIDSMLTSVSVLREGLDALWQGMEAGFQRAFSNLIHGVGNLKDAVTTIIGSMIDAVISELAKLAAAKLFQLLLSFVGVPGVGALGGGSLGLPDIGLPDFGGLVPGLSAARVGPQVASATPAVVEERHFHLYGMNTHDMAMSLTHPGGELRRATDRLSIVSRF